MNTQEQEIVISDEAIQMAIAIHDSFIRTPNYELSMTRIAMMIDEVKRQAVQTDRAKTIKLFNEELETADESYSDINPKHLYGWKSAIRFCKRIIEGT